MSLRLPDTVGVTTTVAVAEAPAARLSVQVTEPPAGVEHDPGLGAVADENAALAGRASVTETVSGETLGFVAFTVYVSPVPTSAEDPLASISSAPVPLVTGVVSVVPVAAGVRLVSFSPTLAALAIVPGAGGTVVARTTIETVALPPTARPLRSHVTVVVPLVCDEHVPWLAVADSTVTPAGRVSVSVVPVEMLGPAFDAVKL
jgi:hypothetical protein